MPDRDYCTSRGVRVPKGQVQQVSLMPSSPEAFRAIIPSMEPIAALSNSAAFPGAREPYQRA